MKATLSVGKKNENPSVVIRQHGRKRSPRAAAAALNSRIGLSKYHPGNNTAIVKANASLTVLSMIPPMDCSVKRVRQPEWRDRNDADEAWLFPSCGRRDRIQQVELCNFFRCCVARKIVSYNEFGTELVARLANPYFYLLRLFLRSHSIES